MTKLQCKECSCIIVDDIEKIKDVKFIQCPYCLRIFENPFYEN